MAPEQSPFGAAMGSFVRQPGEGSLEAAERLTAHLIEAGLPAELLRDLYDSTSMAIVGVHTEQQPVFALLCEEGTGAGDQLGRAQGLGLPGMVLAIASVQDAHGDFAQQLNDAVFGRDAPIGAGVATQDDGPEHYIGDAGQIFIVRDGVLKIRVDPHLMHSILELLMFSPADFELAVEELEYGDTPWATDIAHSSLLVDHDAKRLRIFSECQPLLAIPGLADIVTAYLGTRRPGWSIEVVEGQKALLDGVFPAEQLGQQRYQKGPLVVLDPDEGLPSGCMPITTIRAGRVQHLPVLDLVGALLNGVRVPPRLPEGHERLALPHHPQGGAVFDFDQRTLRVWFTAPMEDYDQALATAFPGWTVHYLGSDPSEHAAIAGETMPFVPFPRDALLELVRQSMCAEPPDRSVLVDLGVWTAEQLAASDRELRQILDERRRHFDTWAASTGPKG